MKSMAKNENSFFQSLTPYIFSFCYKDLGNGFCFNLTHLTHLYGLRQVVTLVQLTGAA